ncbi:MAG: hypothetical protein NVS4B3_02120 [Gemmatimonadaceae bacterium]
MTLEIPSAGFTLLVPKDAVLRPVTITATLLPGDQLAYEFEPHGITFARPLLIKQRLDDTDADGDQATAAHLVAGYFPSTADLAPAASGLTHVVELVPATTDAASNTFAMAISHFSGYIIALGTSTTSPPALSPPTGSTP